MPPWSISQNSTRTFTSSRLNLKTGGKQHAKSNISRASAKASAIPDDPFDFTDYEASIEKIHERLKSDLSKIKAGGRDPEAIEHIRVNIKKGGTGESNTQAKIGDLASVMQRGRNVVIMVAEKEVRHSFGRICPFSLPQLTVLQCPQHVKPITSSLHSLPNTTPQSAPPGGDPLHITLPIPPTTRESRLEASKIAQEKGDRANFELKEARGAQKKRLRALELAKIAGPDQIRKATEKMEKVNEKAGGGVKKLVEDGKRRVEGG